MENTAGLWFDCMLDVTLKSWLLGLTAWTMILTVGKGNSNLQHRLWICVLCGMLALPLMVQVVPPLPLPSWLPANGHLAEQPTSFIQSNVSRSSELHFNNAPLEFDAVTLAHSSTRSTAQLLQPNKLGIDLSQATADESLESGAFFFKSALLIAYIAVTSALLARRAIGLVLVQKLVRQASAIDGDQGPRLACRGRLLESQQVSVPVTIGYWHPTILLPVDWRSWPQEKRESVLAHESAHVRRADWLVNSIAEICSGLYWFNPLAWFVRSRLSELAESNCDDAVITELGNRIAYARHLLEIAISLPAIAHLHGTGPRWRLPNLGTAWLGHQMCTLKRQGK